MTTETTDYQYASREGWERRHIVPADAPTHAPSLCGIHPTDPARPWRFEALGSGEGAVCTECAWVWRQQQAAVTS